MLWNPLNVDVSMFWSGLPESQSPAELGDNFGVGKGALPLLRAACRVWGKEGRRLVGRGLNVRSAGRRNDRSESLDLLVHDKL
jgi:hypothetical protein